MEIFPDIRSDFRKIMEIHKKVSLVFSAVQDPKSDVILSQASETNLNFVFLRQSPASLLAHWRTALPSLAVSCLIGGGGEDQIISDNPLL